MAGTVQQEMKMESQVLRDYVNRRLDSTTFVAATFATPWWMVQSASWRKFYEQTVHGSSPT